MKIKNRKIKIDNKYYYVIIESTVQADGIYIPEKVLKKAIKNFKPTKKLLKYDEHKIGEIISAKPIKSKGRLAIQLKCKIKKDIPAHLAFALHEGKMKLTFINGQCLTLIPTDDYISERIKNENL